MARSVWNKKRIKPKSPHSLEYDEFRQSHKTLQGDYVYYGNELDGNGHGLWFYPTDPNSGIGSLIPLGHYDTVADMDEIVTTGSLDKDIRENRWRHKVLERGQDNAE